MSTGISPLGVVYEGSFALWLGKNNPTPTRPACIARPTRNGFMWHPQRPAPFTTTVPNADAKASRRVDYRGNMITDFWGS
ncbi:MAG: hypothetical protein DVB22_002139 [Verrucomicrobia bacterium]|nr:MAG: hypothetical protein DVB22_002139 [Verrucomicrobiota bacterium]